MNEQFIILAEKVNNVTSIAESLIPEVIQQTLEYNLYGKIVWLCFFVLITIVLSVLTYKNYKKGEDEWSLLSPIVLIAAGFVIGLSIDIIQITYYPYSWLYTHFLG